MRLSALLIFIFGPIISIYGQKIVADSLKRELQFIERKRPAFARDTARVSVLNELGKARMATDSSIIDFEKALEIAESINWNKGICLSINNLGRKLKKQSNFMKAGELFYRALGIAQKEKNLILLAFSHRNIADNYNHLQQNDSSLQHYNKAINFYKTANHKEGVLVCYNNIGNLYYSMKDYRKAISYYQLVSKINNSSVPVITIYEGYSVGNAAASYNELGEYDKAIEYAKKGIEILKPYQENHPEDIVSFLIMIGQAYNFKKQYDDAIKVGMKALSINQKGNNEFTIKVNHVLYNAYLNKGDYKKALSYYQTEVVLRDSSNKESFEDRIKSIRFGYENQQQKEQIQDYYQRDIQNKRERTLLLIVMALFVVFLVSLYWNNRLIKKKKQLIEQQKSELETTKDALSEANQSLTELNGTLEEKVEIRTQELTQAYQTLVEKNREIQEAMFKGQSLERKRVASELHDSLGSTLSALKWQLESMPFENLTEPEQKAYHVIIEMMTQAYKEVRLISHNLLPEELAKRGLKKSLDKLIQDLNNSRSLHIELEDELEHEPVLVVSFEVYNILLELLNNIFKHAKAQNAYISLKENKDSLFIEVQDDGLGFDIEKAKRGKGIQNIQERVQSLQGILQMTAEKGTKVVIQIPLLSESQKMMEAVL